MHYIGDFRLGQDVIYYSERANTPSISDFIVIDQDGVSEPVTGEVVSIRAGMYSIRIETNGISFFANDKSYAVVNTVDDSLICQFSITNRNGNVSSLQGDTLDGYNATLRLRKLDINNSEQFDPAVEINAASYSEGIKIQGGNSSPAVDIICGHEGTALSLNVNESDPTNTGRGFYIRGKGYEALQINSDTRSAFLYGPGGLRIQNVNADVIVEESLSNISDKLPEGNISSYDPATAKVDGITHNRILELVMAMVNGRFRKDYPSQGQITFYKRDNSTILFTVNISDTERTLEA